MAQHVAHVPAGNERSSAHSTFFLAQLGSAGSCAPMAHAHTLSWDDALRIRRRGLGVRVHRAHEFLHRLRIELSNSGDAGVDLTQQIDRFDWRGYLANHSDEWLECIFGESRWNCRNRGSRRIVKFEARFLRFWDEETAGPRFDFIAHRDDGLHFRLHPGSSPLHFTEPWPIPGDVRSWAVEDGAGRALAANPSPAASQEPWVTDGRDFLQRQVQAWEHHHPRRRFTRDLTSGTDFAWDLFLHRGDANAQRLIHRGVVECWLVWLGYSWQRAAFYFCFNDGAATVYYATTNDGRWVSDERLVEDVYWPA